jgi:DNA-binding transcriptional regulator WhiA
MSWTIEEVDYLKQNYGTIPTGKMVSIINHGRSAIKHMARKLDLHADRIKMTSLAKKQYFVDDTFFNNYSLISCYWAGLIVADGCINENRLCLGLNDHDHVFLFRKYLKYTGPIEYDRKQAKIRIRNQDIITDLEKWFNITKNKSLTLKPPKINDVENRLAFIAGYIDGDGCIHHNKENKIELSILGTAEVLSWIKDVFDTQFPKKYISNIRLAKQDGKIYSYKIVGHKALLILDRIKSLQLPLLNRKWNN